MNKIVPLLTLTLTGLVATTVSASGAMPIPPAPTFNGLFLEGNVGSLNLLSNNQFTTTSTYLGTSMNQTHSDIASLGSALIGLQLGYGRVFDQNFYIAGKGTFQYAPFEYKKSSNVVSLSPLANLSTVKDADTKAYPFYGLDAEFGYLASQNFLGFVEVGVTFAKVTNTVLYTHIMSNNTNPALNASATTTLQQGRYQAGVNTGVGFKYILTPSWLLNTEFIYSYLGKQTSSIAVNWNPATAGSIQNTLTSKNQSLVLMLGVSYLFNV